MVGGGRPLLPEILGQLARVGEKSPIFNQYAEKRMVSGDDPFYLKFLVNSPLERNRRFSTDIRL